MNARLYDPLVGRFLSPDPFVQAPGFTQSFNRYSYVWNNPLRWVDPTGMIVTRPGSTNKQWWEDDDDWWNDDGWWQGNDDFTNLNDLNVTGSRNGHGTSGWWSDFWSWKNARSAGSFGIGAFGVGVSGRMLIEVGYVQSARWHRAYYGNFSRTIQHSLREIKNVSKGTGVVGLVFIGVDVGMSGEVRPSHWIDAGVAMGTLFGGKVGAGIAAGWFLVDFGAILVNPIFGNDPMRLGTMIDRSDWGQRHTINLPW